jgi:anti-anti-sigma factor
LEEAVKEEISLVVFNLQDVEYVCSLFLGICVKTMKSAQNKEFVITNVQPSVKKLFKISGLDKIINVQ